MASVTGGGDRAELDPRGVPLVPLCGEASPRGTHVGHNVNLNVPNPQPGYIYYWARSGDTRRGASQLYRLHEWGYERVTAESPEFKSRAASLRYSAMGLDSYHTHGDVMLLRIPEHKYREFNKWRAEARKAALEGSTESYLQTGSELEARAGYSRADAPYYYRAASHGFQTT